jgi:hypothetical protein
MRHALGTGKFHHNLALVTAVKSCAAKPGRGLPSFHAVGNILYSVLVPLDMGQNSGLPDLLRYAFAISLFGQGPSQEMNRLHWAARKDVTGTEVASFHAPHSPSVGFTLPSRKASTCLIYLRGPDVVTLR